MASYFIELREAMAKDEDDPSPEANQVENPLPADEEIIELILSCWEDELYDRYEDIEHKVTDADAITMVEGRKPVHCPYCGGREVFDKHAAGRLSWVDAASPARTRNGSVTSAGSGLGENNLDMEYYGSLLKRRTQEVSYCPWCSYRNCKSSGHVY